MSINRGMDKEDIVHATTHTHTHTHHGMLAIKKNKIMLFAAAWIDLEIVILSEMSDTERQISKTLHSQYLGPGSIPSQGIRSCMPQLRVYMPQ